MNILQQNSTHKAIQEGNVIVLYTKGFECGDVKCKDERLYEIEHKDDLFAIFERLDEDNRINIAEFIDCI